MKIVHNGNLYNLPAHTNHAIKIGSTANFKLLHQWVNVNSTATTNTHQVFYQFNLPKRLNSYWILARDLAFNLNTLRGHHHRLERMISAGERLVGHSRYNEHTRHYDCSSFVRHLYAKAGIHLGSVTYSQAYDGRSVNPKHLKRGDLIFFNDRSDGRNAHVGIYLGHGLFLHDSPYSATGGVCVSSLHDPFWSTKHSRHASVHYFNGIARRVI